MKPKESTIEPVSEEVSISATRSKNLGNVLKTVGASVVLTLLGCGNTTLRPISALNPELSNYISRDQTKHDKWKIRITLENTMKYFGIDLQFIKDSGLPSNYLNWSNHKGLFEKISYLKALDPKFNPENLNLLKEIGIKWWEVESPQKIQLYLKIVNVRYKGGEMLIQGKKRREGYMKLIQYLVGEGYHTGIIDYTGFLRDREAAVIVDFMNDNPEWKIEDVIDVVRTTDIDEGPATSEDLSIANSEGFKRIVINLRKKIIETRKYYEEREIIGKGKAVTIFANNEEKNEELRFANNELISRIKKISGHDPRVVVSPKHTQNKKENLNKHKAFKKAVKDAIVNAPPDHRFVFSGHGSREAFSFKGGDTLAEVDENDASGVLSSEELATYFQERYRKAGKEKMGDVIIMNACYASNIVRPILECIKRAKQNTLIISSTGKELPSITNFSLPTGSKFFELVFPDDASSSTLGGLIEYDKKRLKRPNAKGEVFESPSIIVPVPKELKEKGMPEYFQISKKNTDSPKKNAQAYS